MKKLFLSLFALCISLTFVRAQLVISEIMFNPPESGADSLEFIEIYNSGTISVDLNGYALDFAGSRRDTFLSSTILNPGGVLVFAVNDSAVFNQYNMTFYPRQWSGTGLSNTGTLIVLRNNTGIVDSVRYASSWEPRSNGTGTSLILCDVNSDNALSTNWDTSATNTGRIINNFPLKGSPGVLETCFVPVPPTYTLYGIATVTGENATTGVADSLNVTCELRGVVHSIDFDNNAGYDLTLIDFNHNGIALFSTTDKNGYTNPAIGDSLRIKGSIVQFNGLTRIQVDSVFLETSANALLTPINVNTAFTEAFESKFVKLTGVTLVDTLQWTTGVGTGFNADVTNGTTIWNLRIDNDCPWFNLPYPSGTIDVFGTVFQFDAASPFDSAYQLRPRIITDIVTQNIIPTVFFTGNSATVNESAGTVSLTLNILSPNTNATSVDVRIGSSSTASSADYQNFTNPTTVTFPGGTSTPQTVTLDIIDDTNVEGTETLVIELLNATNSGLFGPDSVYTITINDNDFAPTPLYNLVITEIMYNNPGADSVEFVEIYNNDTVAVNLLGYQITNGIFITFPSYVLNPGAYVVTCLDSVLFQQRFGVTAFKWNTGNSLNNTAEPLVLRNDQGIILDSVYYRNSLPWPTSAAGNGPSAQLCNVNSDNNLGTSWGASNNPTGALVNSVQILATPGAANTYCRPPYTLASIGDIDNTNANGEPDSLGLTYEIRGIVHCGDFRVGVGLDFYLIDFNQEGINVFSFPDRGYTVNDGDSLHILGELSQGIGTTEILIDSIIFISSGNPTQTPQVISVPLSEVHEGNLIQLNNVSLVNPTQWAAAGTGFNVDVTDGSNTWQLRIDDAVDLYTQPAPTGSFNVYGFGSQFDNLLPYNSGYQLLACNSSITPATGTVNIDNETISIYPNPVLDVLNIKAELMETVVISNLLGQEMLRMENVNSNYTELSTSKLASGVYQIVVISNGKMTIKQFIKA
jgi:hypothetical protein